MNICFELEKTVPASVNIVVGNPALTFNDKESSQITNIFHQHIQGGNTTIQNTGKHASITVNVNKADTDSFIKELESKGIPKEDATELATIVQSETSTSPQEPLGKKAQSWIVKNLQKALNGGWKMGTSVATEVITEAVKQYYGLD